MLVLSVVWVACKKSKSNTPDPVIARGVSAKINGVLWTTNVTSVTSITGIGSTENYVDITAYDTAGRTIDLRINNFKTRGTFHVPQANDSAFYSTDYGALISPSAATSGTIAIQIVNDTAVGGTFSFTVPGGITVTEGTFNVNF